MVVNGAGFVVISFLPFLGPGALCCWSTAMVIPPREAAPWNRQLLCTFSVSCFPRGSKMLRKLATKHYNKIWSWFPLHFHPRSPSITQGEILEAQTPGFHVHLNRTLCLSLLFCWDRKTTLVLTPKPTAASDGVRPGLVMLVFLHPPPPLRTSLILYHIPKLTAHCAVTCFH